MRSAKHLISIKNFLRQSPLIALDVAASHALARLFYTGVVSVTNPMTLVAWTDRECLDPSSQTTPGLLSVIAARRQDRAGCEMTARLPCTTNPG